MSDYQRFPAWRYRHGEARIFNTAEDLAEAGPGWYDSPAAIPAAPAEAEQVSAATEAPEAAASGADYSGLDKPALLALAASEAVEVDGRWSRAKIIVALEEHAVRESA